MHRRPDQLLGAAGAFGARGVGSRLRPR
jgi:hypothetical protein